MRFNKATVGTLATALLGVLHMVFPAYTGIIDLAAPVVIGAAVYAVPNVQ